MFKGTVSLNIYSNSEREGMDTKLSETFKQPFKKVSDTANTKAGTDG